MKRLWFLLCAVAVSLLAGCNPEEAPESGGGVKDNSAYLALVKAYREGRIFTSVDVRQSSDAVFFEEDIVVEVPHQAFRIHDCRNTSPAEVSRQGNWWAVGGTVYGIMVDMSLSDEEAVPVYAWYDSKTLHLHLSNTHVLDFNSRVLEDEKLQKEEIARRQNIPVIYIDTGGKGIYDKDNYVDGTITIKDPEKLYSDNAEFSAKMGIRGRGNSTWSFPKKPWKVKLKEAASLLGMPADKEWALLANYADRTLLRNITAMHLSEICGFSWTPRMRSVEVYLNNSYQGVYTLCEHKKVSADRVNIDVDGGDLYLEIEEQQDETTCWWTGMGVPMMFSDPEEPSAQVLEATKKMFNDFESALRNNDYSESTGYPKYIDVDSFIDYYIVQELTKNIDGNLRKSSFITIEKGGRMEMYHLWDFDLTLGNAGYFGAEVGNGYENYWIKRDRWYPYLFRDPAFVDRLQARWAELYPQLAKVPEFIDLQALYLDKAKDRNFQKWSIWESVDWVKFPSLGSYEKELEYLKEFYKRRLGWLNVELNRL